MKWPARRISESSPKSFGMYEKAMGLVAEGKDVISLAVGMPFADTPVHIKEATKRALDAGQVHYSDFRGLPELREALAEKLRTYNKLDVTADNVLVTNGLTHASYASFMASIDPGDEVILLEPYYPQHVNKIEMAGGKVVMVPMDASDNFRLRADWIEAKITPQTRMIVIVNPANPTGRVFTRTELEELAEVAIRHDLLVMSDEVYDQILYDGREHISIGSLPGMAERTLSLFAFTKAYAMDGWRLGCAVVDKRFMPALMKITMNDVAHVNTFIQHGAVAALKGPQDCLDSMHAEDERKRALVLRALNQMAGVTCVPPEGTIYAFPNISATGRTSVDLANAILAEAHVVVEAGTFYGPAGEGHLRICFGAESYERIDEAMTRLGAFFGKL
ncbi:pyridoxal phosphate-dependent aminotransferase [Govanella unica]|uniref:aspartate transaminase n=1 Tax=Govanella unica TaxID=2975056 RepID=A0A9X3TYE0_9PROT|nr:pyridoxal phosphate-dependent aminotransferase [Govania unica]MDA5193962.1 pyridoxal phosphate-dependent aminotransferase [Govania unica]